MDLIGAEVRKCLAQPFRQIIEQRFDILRGRRATDVTGDIDIVERAKRRALREAARQHHFPEREVRVLGEIALQLFAKPPGLGPIFIRLVLRQVDLVLREGGDLIMTDVLSPHIPLLFPGTLAQPLTWI